MTAPHSTHTSSRPFSGLFAGLLALSLALVISAALGARALSQARRGSDQVEVTGSAKRSIRADYAVWRGTVSSQGPALPPAYQELKRFGDRVQAFLTARGLPDSSITVRTIETTVLNETGQDGRETGRIAGYRLAQTFEVRSVDIDAVTRLSREVSTLINEGIPLSSPPPEYLYTRLAEVRIALLEEATRDAQARAAAIARATGADVGGVREARSGVFQITPRFSTDVSDYGSYDTSSIDKDITAVVRVTFGIN